MINKENKTKTFLLLCQCPLLVDLWGFSSVGVRNIRYKVHQMILQVEHKVVKNSKNSLSSGKSRKKLFLSFSHKNYYNLWNTCWCAYLNCLFSKMIRTLIRNLMINLMTKMLWTSSINNQFSIFKLWLLHLQGGYSQKFTNYITEEKEKLYNSISLFSSLMQSQLFLQVGEMRGPFRLAHQEKSKTQYLSLEI